MKQFIFILLLLPGVLFANGKKGPPASISFHLEGSADEAPRFAFKVKTLAGEGYYRRVPEIGSKDIIAFSPFPADDKQTYGIVFKVNTQASRRLQATTSQHQGKLLLALVNGQSHTVLRIDKQVTDGILVIWSGIQLEQIKLYDQLVPRIGENEKEWKKRLKEEKKKAKK